MESVLQLVTQRQDDLDRHPLFEWMNADQTPAEQPLMLLPTMAPFSMGFRDVNKWVFRYPEAATDLERGINIHTFEDQTHSRLFLEDWRRLGLDRRLGWSASDTLWWLFLAEDTEVARGNGVYFLSMATADRRDPLLRFAHSEMMEALGSVFFKHVSKIASRYAAETGTDLPYMGPFHMALESGHMDCEDLFEQQILDGGRRDHALRLADTMFGIFADTLDMWWSYAQRYLSTGVPPRPPAPMSVVTPDHRSPGQASGVRPRTEGLVHQTQARVQRLLEERRARTATHPFYTWLHNRGDRTSALQALRRFIPMWAMDVMGYRDLNRYAMRYPEATSDLEHAVNGWVDDLTTHNTLYLDDWRQLGLDDLLGWGASDTLEFCYLDPQTDVHRRNIVKFTELAVGHQEAQLRLWLMHALEASGEDFFRHTQTVAREAEATAGARLGYLAARHDIAHRPAPSGIEVTVAFKDRPMTTDQAEVAAEMVETVFDAADEQLDISLDVALSNKFGIA